MHLFKTMVCDICCITCSKIWLNDREVEGNTVSLSVFLNVIFLIIVVATTIIINITIITTRANRIFHSCIQ